MFCFNVRDRTLISCWDESSVFVVANPTNCAIVENKQTSLGLRKPVWHVLFVSLHKAKADEATILFQYHHCVTAYTHNKIIRNNVSFSSRDSFSIGDERSVENFSHNRPYALFKKIKQRM